MIESLLPLENTPALRYFLLAMVGLTLYLSAGFLVDAVRRFNANRIHPGSLLVKAWFRMRYPFNKKKREEAEFDYGFDWEDPHDDNGGEE